MSVFDPQTAEEKAQWVPLNLFFGSLQWVPAIGCLLPMLILGAILVLVLL